MILLLLLLVTLFTNIQTKTPLLILKPRLILICSLRSRQKVGGGRRSAPPIFCYQYFAQVNAYCYL
ncbi:MAG: putative malate dehydrogenase, NAD(P)-binding [Inoviridae sp.]|nr:MAG: putative malate dehydrogenase, NAD(P)-binding [Inoviridae sp.]